MNDALNAIGLSASLAANDLEASLAWYVDVVGFEVDQKHEREGKLVAASLKAGNARIVIGRDDGGKGWDRVKGAGCSLQFMTNSDVDAIAKRIKEHGGTLDAEQADMPWGVRAFRLVDPDGYKLLISSERK